MTYPSAYKFSGSAGPQGIQGQTGFYGPTGIYGPTGVNGATGITGFTGLALGSTGIQGITGLANFWERVNYPGIGVDHILLWNETDEALFVGVTGVNHWVQISAGSPQGDHGDTGIQGITGLANFWQQASYPSISGVTPILLWNEDDEALYVGATGIPNWVQISAGSLQGATGFSGPTGIQGLTGIYGVTGIYGLTGLRGLTGAGGTGIQGITGIYGLTGIGDNIRTFTWSVSAPISGGVFGPKLYEPMTAIKVSSYSDQTCTFNIQDRTSSPGTAGLTLMITDQTALPAGTDSTVLQNTLLTSNSWVYLNITGTSNSPTKLVVTVAGTV